MNLTREHETILAAYSAAADAGAPCPSTWAMYRQSGISRNRIQTITGHLRAWRLIAIEGHPGNKNRRRVQVSGRWSGWTETDTSRETGPDGPDVEDADAYMAAAMRGRRYEDVPASLFDDGAAVPIYRAPTYVATQASAA